MDHLEHLFPIAAAHHDRLAVDADLVWQDEVVATGPLGQWNAVVQAQELRAMLDSRLAHCLGIRPVFDDDVDVIQFGAEFFWQIVPGLGDELFKEIMFHNRHIITASVYSGT